MSESKKAFVPLAIRTTDALSSHFIRTHYPGKAKCRWKFSAGLLSFFCILGVALCPTDTSMSAQKAVPKRPKAVHGVTVTAYTNVPSCTDSTPNQTASLLKIRPKHYWRIIALSRDLAKHYKFGDKFELWVDGRVYFVEFQDVMAKRHKGKIDFLLPSVEKCLKFGVNRGVLIPIDGYEADGGRQSG